MLWFVVQVRTTEDSYGILVCLGTGPGNGSAASRSSSPCSILLILMTDTFFVKTAYHFNSSGALSNKTREVALGRQQIITLAQKYVSFDSSRLYREEQDRVQDIL